MAYPIEVIFKALISAYHSQKMPELTSFSTYTAYISRQRPRSISYWQKLLKGSKHTDVGVNFLPKTILDSMPVPFRIENEIAFPKTHTGITTASFMSATWAVFLSRILKEVVGSCINIVPVRGQSFIPPDHDRAGPLETEAIHFARRSRFAGLQRRHRELHRLARRLQNLLLHDSLEPRRRPDVRNRGFHWQAMAVRESPSITFLPVCDFVSVSRQARRSDLYSLTHEDP
jgi:hypothetical protein